MPTTAAHIAIPRVLSDAAVNWTDEGAEITPSDLNADTIVATPRNDPPCTDPAKAPAFGTRNGARQRE